MTKKLLTLENIRSGAVPSDAVAVGFLLGEVERLQKQMEILQRANRFLSEQIPPAPEPKVGETFPEKLRARIAEMRTALYTYGPYGEPIGSPLLDGVVDAIDELQGASRDLSASEAASFAKTLARSPRRIIPARDADHCDYPDCEQHWTYVVAQARALLEPLAEHDPAIRQWLKTPGLPSLDASRDASPTLHCIGYSPTLSGFGVREGSPEGELIATFKRQADAEEYCRKRT